MINFSCTRARNYRQVQRQLMGRITRHLPDGSWTTTRRTYVEGALNFTFFVDFEADVLMSHGAADKNYHWRRTEDGTEYLNNVQRRTDLLVPGPFLRERIVASDVLDLDAEHVHSVGWPRLDLLIRRQDARRRAEREQPALQRWRQRRRRKRVLWAPTHDWVRRSTPVSSYPDFLPYVERLEQYFDVSVSLHPRNRRTNTPTRAPLLDADVVITDFGTMLYEGWVLGKQVIFPDWIIGEAMAYHCPRSSENKIFRERLGLHPDNFEAMMDMIEQGTGLDERAVAHRDHYLDPLHHKHSGKRIADLLLAMDAERNGAVHPEAPTAHPAADTARDNQ
ncbi:MAG: hypothetical protein ACRDO8_08865 [Nocardioidaceae bacterium]